MQDHDIEEAKQHTLAMESDKRHDSWVQQRKSVSCKNRDKGCEAHGLPCDVCNGYKPIGRVRTKLKGSIKSHFRNCTDPDCYCRE